MRLSRQRWTAGPRISLARVTNTSLPPFLPPSTWCRTRSGPEVLQSIPPSWQWSPAARCGSKEPTPSGSSVSWMPWKIWTTSPRFSPTSISTRLSWQRRKPEAPSVKGLGIDPGTAVLGYGVIETGSSRHPLLIECGTLTTATRESLPQRLRVLYEGVAALLTRHHPTAMAIETAFYGRNVRTAVVLSHARGVILLAAE